MFGLELGALAAILEHVGDADGGVADGRQ